MFCFCVLPWCPPQGVLYQPTTLMEGVTVCRPCAAKWISPPTATFSSHRGRALGFGGSTNVVLQTVVSKCFPQALKAAETRHTGSVCRPPPSPPGAQGRCAAPLPLSRHTGSVCCHPLSLPAHRVGVPSPSISPLHRNWPTGPQFLDFRRPPSVHMVDEDFFFYCRLGVLTVLCPSPSRLSPSLLASRCHPLAQ